MPCCHGCCWGCCGGSSGPARFQASEGKLIVLYGNMIMQVRAFYGPDVSLDNANGDYVGAIKQWLQDTSATRKEQGSKLARAIIKQL